MQKNIYFLLFLSQSIMAQNFIQVKDKHFKKAGKPYYYLGTGLKKHTVEIFKFLIVVLFISTTHVSFCQAPVKSILPESIPAWVKSYQKPSLKKEYDLDLVLVQDESQFNHVTGEYFRRSFYYLNTTKGLNQIRSFSLLYEPDYQTIHLHNITIHRGKKKIHLESNLHTEFLYHNKQVNGEFYANDAKVTLYLERVKVGDLIEFAYTKKGIQPDIGDALKFVNSINDKELRGKDIVRVLTHPNNNIHYTVLNFDLDFKKKKTAEYLTLEGVFETEKKLKPINGPDWYEKHKVVYFTDYKSWEDEVDHNLNNYLLEEIPSSKIKEQTNELVKDANNKEEQVKKILTYIQDGIEYLDYDMINPKRPETVLRQGFGDCKSKSLLTIKMLECIGIKAWPVIVRTGGLDDRYLDAYTLHPLNHVIVEFVYEGDTILYDGTKPVEYGNIFQTSVTDFRYGLRIIKGNNQLTKFERKPGSKISYNCIVIPSLNYDDEWTYLIDRNIHLYGNIANEKIDVYKNKGIKEVSTQLFKGMSSSVCNSGYLKPAELNLDSFIFDTNQPHAILYGESKYCDQPIISEYNAFNLTPQPLYDWFHEIIFIESGQYFSLPDFEECEFKYQIVLDTSINFIPDTFNLKTDWLEFSKHTWLSGDTICAFFNAKILKTFLPEERFKEVREDIKILKDHMDINFEGTVSFEEGNKRQESLTIGGWIFLAVVAGCIILLIWWASTRKAKVRDRNKYILGLKKDIETLKRELDIYKNLK